MIKLTKKMSSVLSIPLLLVTSCAGLATSGFNKNNTVGRDVDEVIVDIQNSGLVCGKKFTSKTVFDNHLYGGVKCYVRESFPICPDFYHVFLSFNLKTNKVDGILKDKRTNCF